MRRRTAIRAAAVLVVAGLVAAGCTGSRSAERHATTTTVAPTTTTTEVPVAAGRQISVYVPSVGDCYDHRTVGTAPNTTQIVLLLPCALPHENQVYATLDYPPSPAFPGTASLQAYAKSNCVANFAAYVGRPYETSYYDLAYELPTQASWSNGIRHVIGCLLVDPKGGHLVGSAQGTKK